MAQFLMLPTNENGIIIDSDILTLDLPTALKSPFDFSDVFLYSHGWCTNASGAMQSYNKFGIGFAKIILAGLTQSTPLPSHLAVGIHWPSMLSEDSNSPTNVFEPLSYYSMEKRADTVGEHAGYSFLRTLFENDSNIKRINLIGHSFGCKVVLSTLQEMADGGISTDIPINVVLLQAACDNDSLEVKNNYGKIINNFPNLKMLITISDQDEALNKWYPLAGEINIFHRDTRKALGAAGGPTIAVGSLFKGDIGQLEIDPGFNANDPENSGELKHKLVIVNLSSIHQYRRNNPQGQPFYNAGSWGGSHSDIFFDELYSAIAKFLY